MAEDNVQSVKKQAENRAIRNDPAPRHADAAAWQPHLRNTDPNRKYVLVNASSNEMGIEFYEDLGYIIEKQRKDGPRIAAGRGSKEGEPVQMYGHHLMSIERSKAEEIRIKGGGGAGLGLEAVEKRDKTMRDRKRADVLGDGFRSDRYMAVRDEGSVEEGLGRSI